ncbi:hypothetical protein TWF569_006109 [Orbilia oligospora]|uniref:NADP-dependent oxidoreductase domain-containing protein n=1 Tax=Orbilia oligospora TaxID=2813651 RepID=A0A7C8NFP7_ORBOL|nr:hypothetical protein TWF102_003440 [Orbilia oligospora]KAF3104732.1 hypothetical protein TWF706_004513 [Orbilia oligospora]KAF3115430.1 hypothetical protein TWF103_010853 [Orbilia oligospora]KAF3131021.1 hypothetical protein TWF703_008015 [Orbilia oligospora]KAF3139753.1 hypothetical protein TWF594_006613 [Orbilia oligospora]
MTERPPLSQTLPPLLLGSATFNSQYNKSPFNLPFTSIIRHFLSSSPKVGFDTSPYYGPAEILLGHSLKLLSPPRNTYFLATKIGRIASSEFDYSPEWIRRSINRSLTRLGVEKLDLVYCHDIEFVSFDEVISAVNTLRELRSEGKIDYIGISGYPVDLLSQTAERIYKITGEGLDAVMSYSNYTIQNTRLASNGLQRLTKGGKVGCVINASLLGMGLLRTQGVPVGDMGDFHPSSDGLRKVCNDAAGFVADKGKKLEEVAYRWALENWADEGGVAGTNILPGEEGKKVGVSVIGVSYLKELESILNTWEDVVKARDGDTQAAGRRKENDDLVEELKGVFGEWYDDIWESPGEDYVREEVKPERLLDDEELWPEMKLLK